MHSEPTVLSQIIALVLCVLILLSFVFLLRLVNIFIKRTNVKGGSTFPDDLNKR